MDIQPHEKVMAKAAGQAAGEYLESIGVFSLDKLTPEQWQCFCEVMCIAYMAERNGDDIPF